MSPGVRFFIIAAFLGLSVYFLYPSFTYYFNTSEEIRNLVESGGKSPAGDTNLSDAQKAEVERAANAKKRAVALGLDIRGGINVLLEADFEKMASDSGKKIEEITDLQKLDALDRVIHKVQSRINEFGLSETSIRKFGKSRIVIQIPGERDPSRILKVIQTSGKLEFRLVDEDATKNLRFNRETLEVDDTNAIPKDGGLYYLYKKNDLAQEVRAQPLILRTNVIMTGERMKDARVSFGEYNDTVVAFTLDLKGAAIFSEVTGNNKGTRLAIVLDGKVMSAPNINERIPSGSGQISGSFTPAEAKDLSLILRSGSLPVPVKIISEEVIGPSMGRESLALSIKALLYSILAIGIFMMLRYRLSGTFASVALILNAFIIFAILAPLHFTVTLPGIAGLILTLGMAVDANVLINERIRDELFKEKRTIFEAIERGYSRAFWTIFDSHVTGLISAFILSNFGEGPVKGFAVTLFIGIVVSLFTSLFVTRFLVDLSIRLGIIKRYTPFVV